MEFKTNIIKSALIHTLPVDRPCGPCALIRLKQTGKRPKEKPFCTWAARALYLNMYRVHTHLQNPL